MKFGVDYSRIRAKSYFNNNTGGTFTFATDRPFDANDLTTYPTQYTQNIGDPNLRRPNDVIGVFAQDSWHVRSNFTLNYGAALRPRDRVQGGDRRGRREPEPRAAFRLCVGPEERSEDGHPRRHRAVLQQGVPQHHRQHPAGPRLHRRHRSSIPGYPDPYSRGSVSPPSAPSTTVAPDEVHTPVTRQTSIGIKRELFGGMAFSADYVNTRGRNLYNAPDVNAPDPVTGLRPEPDLPAHRRVPVDRQLLVQRDAAGPRAPRRPRTRVRALVHAVEADARRRGLRLHAAEQLRPRGREGAGEQRSPAPVRRERGLPAAVDDADRPVRAGALGTAVQRHDRRRQQPRHHDQRSARPREPGWRSAARVDLQRELHGPRRQPVAQLRARARLLRGALALLEDVQRSPPRSSIASSCSSRRSTSPTT